MCVCLKWKNANSVQQYLNFSAILQTKYLLPGLLLHHYTSNTRKPQKKCISNFPPITSAGMDLEVIDTANILSLVTTLTSPYLHYYMQLQFLPAGLTKARVTYVWVGNVCIIMCVPNTQAICCSLFLMALENVAYFGSRNYMVPQRHAVPCDCIF